MRSVGRAMNILHFIRSYLFSKVLKLLRYEVSIVFKTLYTKHPMVRIVLHIGYELATIFQRLKHSRFQLIAEKACRYSDCFSLPCRIITHNALYTVLFG